jgi:DNA (cytosine-5)-methyltransferase 1
MQPCYLRHQPVIPQLSGRRRPNHRGAIAARGEEPLNCRSEDAADELDPETTPVFIDEPDHLGQGRSSSFANNTLAALRISFALRSSAISFCNRLISAAASVVTPGFSPASTS